MCMRVLYWMENFSAISSFSSAILYSVWGEKNQSRNLSLGESLSLRCSRRREKKEWMNVWMNGWMVEWMKEKKNCWLLFVGRVQRSTMNGKQQKAKIKFVSYRSLTFCVWVRVCVCIWTKFSVRKLLFYCQWFLLVINWCVQNCCEESSHINKSILKQRPHFSIHFFRSCQNTLSPSLLLTFFIWVAVYQKYKSPGFVVSNS